MSPTKITFCTAKVLLAENELLADTRTRGSIPVREEWKSWACRRRRRSGRPSQRPLGRSRPKPVLQTTVRTPRLPIEDSDARYPSWFLGRALLVLNCERVPLYPGRFSFVRLSCIIFKLTKHRENIKRGNYSKLVKVLLLDSLRKEHLHRQQRTELLRILEGRNSQR
jgi:hypothetical protein